MLSNRPSVTYVKLPVHYLFGVRVRVAVTVPSDGYGGRTHRGAQAAQDCLRSAQAGFGLSADI